MSIEGQGHFFTLFFPGFVCFVLYYAEISGERLQDHWSSGYYMLGVNLGSLLYGDVSVMKYCGNDMPGVICVINMSNKYNLIWSLNAYSRQ